MTGAGDRALRPFGAGLEKRAAKGADIGGAKGAIHGKPLKIAMF